MFSSSSLVPRSGKSVQFCFFYSSSEMSTLVALWLPFVPTCPNCGCGILDFFCIVESSTERRGLNMAEKAWSTLSTELAQAAEQAGRSVVAVHGWRYPASGIFLSGDAIVTVNHAVRGEEARVVLSKGERIASRGARREPGTDRGVR